MTEQERALAIQVLDTKVGVAHNVTVQWVRSIVLECIEEFCRLQESQKGASHDN